MSFDVDITVAPGERAIACRIASGAKLTALFGPSGVGKTSVLNAIAGLLRPQAGRIVMSGEVLFDAGEGIDLPPEKRRTGYVFQDTRLFPHLSVAANLAYGVRLAEPSQRWITQGETVALLGIEDLLDRSPATLSGGEARRVAIGRALLSAPRFLLLDEPFSALDQARTEVLARLIERIKSELDIPILLVSHSAAETARLADHTVELAG